MALGLTHPDIATEQAQSVPSIADRGRNRLVQVEQVPNHDHCLSGRRHRRDRPVREV